MASPEQDRFDELYRTHRGAVYRFLLRDLRNREDAEDATQTAFLQAFSAYERGSRPERPRAWLLTIADNLRKRRFRSDRRAHELPLDEAAFEPPAPDERVEGLRDALAALPFNQRAALVLREVAGLSYAEIARNLGVSLNAVQMLVFRARRNVREQLETAARRAGAFAPTWLTNLLPGVERLPALRAGGAAAVAAVAALAVSGAESAVAPPELPERLRPVAAAVEAGPRPQAGPVRRPYVEPATPTPPPGVPPAPRVAPAPPRPTPSAPQRAAEEETPLLAELVRPLPPLPTPPAVTVPSPALPLPPLPVDVPVDLEGALEPQLDAVLTGR